MVYEPLLLHGSSMPRVNGRINRLPQSSSLIASSVMNIFLKHLWKNATMLLPGLTDLSVAPTKVMLEPLIGRDIRRVTSNYVALIC